ncbi:MAG: fructosamine kinase family protein [Flavobacteriales bacterium]|nr:fructosamine kinase family protein [Flavobacteriales bacterium]MCB9203620.1 fructosamine kinase family protein [Flavobacteriales bacterium]
MNPSFREELGEFLSLQNLGKLLAQQTVTGGSINDAFKIETTSGTYFLKANCAKTYPNMFEAETKGLELLSNSSFRIPKPMALSVSASKQFLLLEWVDKGSPKTGFWDDFGRNLAEMHSISNTQFGLNLDNYIGSLPQRNSEHGTWTDFYREERLVPQMNLAEKNGQLTSRMQHGFEALFGELEDIFPKEKPSLLHGDLWSGNMMVASDGSPCIFDPAVYYGHREMDLAMMALFGGFGDAWIGAYNEVYPLENGWKERIAIGQLYPLMVHVNLFGGGYRRSVENILSRFS